MAVHKWAKEIKAWADGAEIEYRYFDNLEREYTEWTHDKFPNWEDIEFEFRIKLTPKDPQYLYVYQTVNGIEFGYPTQIHPVHNHRDKFTCIGKIKLEVNDAV